MLSCFENKEVEKHPKYVDFLATSLSLHKILQQYLTYIPYQYEIE